MEAAAAGKGIFPRRMAAIAAVLLATGLPSAYGAPSSQSSNYFELAAGFYFNKTTYDPTDYTWCRRWTASFGYHFWGASELELSFQDALNRTMIVGNEDTTFHDQIYSLDWVQGFAPKDAFLQPYAKAGIGQLNRNAYGYYYALGTSPPLVQDSITAIAGLGLRVRITDRFGLRAEATSYLTGPAISTWKDNISGTAGLSFYF